MASRLSHSESQHHLGDDVLLDLVGAAVDRGLAPVEVVRRDGGGIVGADRSLVPPGALGLGEVGMGEGADRLDARVNLR